jgi:hypothetical protein
MRVPAALSQLAGPGADDGIPAMPEKVMAAPLIADRLTCTFVSLRQISCYD